MLSVNAGSTTAGGVTAVLELLPPPPQADKPTVSATHAHALQDRVAFLKIDVVFFMLYFSNDVNRSEPAFTRWAICVHADDGQGQAANGAWVVDHTVGQTVLVELPPILDAEVNAQLAPFFGDAAAKSG